MTSSQQDRSAARHAKLQSFVDLKGVGLSKSQMLSGATAPDGCSLVNFCHVILWSPTMDHHFCPLVGDNLLLIPTPTRAQGNATSVSFFCCRCATGLGLRGAVSYKCLADHTLFLLFLCHSESGLGAKPC